MQNLDNKLTKIQEDITEIKETLVRNTTSLEIHMKRTELAEANIQNLQNQDLSLEKKVDAHINKVYGAGWAIGIISTLIFVLWQMGILAKLF